MGNILGKSKKSRVTEQDKAVLQLKQQRDKLKIYQKRLEDQLEKDRDLARKLIKDGKKDRAMLLLRKKRFLEQQINKAEGMLSNVEQMTHDLEFTQVEMKVLESLKQGNTALKAIHSVLSIEEIENIMEETKEGIEKQREIDEILQGHLTSEDEDAVLEELNEILGAAADEKLVTLPPAPVTQPVAELSEEEEEEETRHKIKEKNKKAKISLEAS